MYELKKPRKAKFGFSLRLSGDARRLLVECAKIENIRKTILDEIPESKETWWFETPNGMGTVSINIYINDEDVYQKVKAAYEKEKEST